MAAVDDYRLRESPFRTHSLLERPRKMQADGFEWDHEIRVALPRSYSRTETRYPVLWILDNTLEVGLLAAERMAFHTRLVPEMIVVSIGCDLTEITWEEFLARRTFEFSPAEFEVADAGAEYIRKWHETGPTMAVGGAGRFLDFLVDVVRPQLASEYRMDPDDHCIAGHSGGGMFVSFALFARPGAFKRYICGSPSISKAIFDLEAEYAKDHDDLPAHVFFGAGEGEMTEGGAISALGLLSSMARMVEILTLREYPSLHMTAKIFPEETHGTLLPQQFAWGLRSVFAEHR